MRICEHTYVSVCMDVYLPFPETEKAKEEKEAGAAESGAEEKVGISVHPFVEKIRVSPPL